ncbi:hypothetical protein E9993_20150 [Labilibacter sediminis]|nr:hypothetical protein E9993_20150 [Labilibacter sediminis]
MKVDELLKIEDEQLVLYPFNKVEHLSVFSMDYCCSCTYTIHKLNQPLVIPLFENILVVVNLCGGD